MRVRWGSLISFLIAATLTLSCVLADPAADSNTDDNSVTQDHDGAGVDDSKWQGAIALPNRYICWQCKQLGHFCTSPKTPIVSVKPVTAFACSGRDCIVFADQWTRAVGGPTLIRTQGALEPIYWLPRCEWGHKEAWLA